MKDLNDFIDKCELNDMPLHERKYTWCNSAEGKKWSEIDRVLVDPKWIERFNLILWGRPKLLSDHCPLLLMKDERDWSPKPFRFLNAWTLHSNFLDFIEKTWKDTMVQGWAGFALQIKLKTLKAAFKNWSKKVFGNVTFKLKSAKDDLHTLDLIAESRDLEEDEKLKRR
ncbi:hypothetical protein ACSBR1_021526 [Camellia fascicularis]